MRLHHLRLVAGSPVERGAEYAAASRDLIVGAVDGYWDHYLRCGGDTQELEQLSREVLGLLSDWSPEQADEIRGIAGGTGMPAWRLAGVVARTELLATLPGAATECSVGVVLPVDGPPRSLQTWDWDPALTTDGVLLEYPTAAGLHVSTFSEFGMTAKIGVNSAGLGVHLNILRHEADGRGAGIPVHCLVREVLSRADTLATAEDIIRSAPVAASSALTVVTVDDAAVFEVSPRDVARIDPVPLETRRGLPAAGAEPDHGLWHTNHFLDPTLASGDAGPAGSTTYARGTHMARRLPAVVAAGPGLPAMAAAMCGPAGEDAPVCLTPGPAAPWATLLTAGIELAPPRLTLHAGTPATVPDETARVGVPCAG